MIRFIDAVMGSGKSTYAIREIRESQDEKFIVAAITLAEVDRYCAACDLQQPESEFSKMSALENLVDAGKSVATTHALLLGISENEQLLGKIKSQGYRLILDEVISSPIFPISIERDTLKTCESADLISIDQETKLISWTAKADYQDRVALRDACLRGEAYCADSAFAVGLMPKAIFEAFRYIDILTYMAEYSLLYKYLKFYSFPTTVSTLSNGALSNALPLYTGKQFKELITLDRSMRRNLNNVTLSSSAVSKIKDKERIRVTKAISGFFDAHRGHVAKDDRLWTTYKNAMPKFTSSCKRPLHDSTNFLQHTCRGTNDYQNTIAAAYVLDKYLNPGIVKFLANNGISYSRSKGGSPKGEDMWALSEMLQWIWRTRIRQGQNIELYVPAGRMRTLLENWLT